MEENPLVVIAGVGKGLKNFVECLCCLLNSGETQIEDVVDLPVSSQSPQKKTDDENVEHRTDAVSLERIDATDVICRRTVRIVNKYYMADVVIVGISCENESSLACIADTWKHHKYPEGLILYYEMNSYDVVNVPLYAGKQCYQRIIDKICFKNSHSLINDIGDDGITIVLNSEVRETSLSHVGDEGNAIAQCMAFLPEQYDSDSHSPIADFLFKLKLTVIVAEDINLSSEVFYDTSNSSVVNWFAENCIELVMTTVEDMVSAVKRISSEHSASSRLLNNGCANDCTSGIMRIKEACESHIWPGLTTFGATFLEVARADAKISEKLSEKENEPEKGKDELKENKNELERKAFEDTAILNRLLEEISDFRQSSSQLTDTERRNQASDIALKLATLIDE